MSKGERKQARFQQGDEEHNYFDTLIKAVTALIGLGVGLFGVVQYIGTLKESERNRSVEVQKENDLKGQELARQKLDAAKPLNDLRLKLYAESADCIANFANLPEGSPDWRNARERFLALYWGDMAFVESANVQKIMYRAWEIIENTPPTTKSLGDSVTQQLDHIAYDLGTAGRQDLEEFRQSGAIVR